MQVLAKAQLNQVTIDAWIWETSSNGLFSIKSTYEAQVVHDTMEDLDLFKNMWSIAAPSYVLAFAWRVMLNRTQTKDYLIRRSIIQPRSDSLCELCEENEESINHMLGCCINQVWMRCYNWLGITFVLHEDARQLFRQHRNTLFTRPISRWWSVWATGIWSIWVQMNDVHFNSGADSVEKVVDLIKFCSWK